MTNGRIKALSGLTMRQKITAILLVVFVIFIIYQVIGLFSERGASSSAQAPSTASLPAPSSQSPIQKPQPVELVAKPAIISPQDQAAIEEQRQIQSQYIAALNQLQSLKVAKEIAEANQAIIAAKLATITAQKSIVDLLSKPSVSQQSYAQGLAGTTNGGPSQSEAPPVVSNSANYTVISVSQLQGKWGAVLGIQGSLYNVSVGDVLPQDQSTVVSIDKSGVVLEKDGVRKKVSLVPAI